MFLNNGGGEMYTIKNLRDDLKKISMKHYVKLKLLQDFVNNRINQQCFVKQLNSSKSDSEISEILGELQKIFEEIRLNGGRIDPDPIEQAKQLRKEGKLQEAFNSIVPYLNENKEDEEAVITFGWIMYNYLKNSLRDNKYFVKNLEIFNDHVVLSFDDITTNQYKKTLVNRIFWLVAEFVKKGELSANKVFPQFMRFCGNNAQFIEKRLFNFKNQISISRLLVKAFLEKLNDTNYLQFMDAIGFDWFDKWDFESSSFTNEIGETIEIKPLAEYVLKFHSKKLLSMDIAVATELRINSFINVLDVQIKNNPSYKWLPYYKGKLLAKVNRKEEALETITSFARTKKKEFWIWDLISELVDEDEKFNCLCAGLLCKTKPEMIVGLQEKIIPILVKKKMFSNAKYELDSLISTRTNRWGKVSKQIHKWTTEKWYLESNAASNRDDLKEYANKAEEILYRTLPITDIFVTYVNKEKGVVNFAYFENRNTIKKGYTYLDSINVNREWINDEVLKVKMISDKKKANLFRIYEVNPGDHVFLSKFIQKGTGIVEKEEWNHFAFVDHVYISPNLVKEFGIEDGDKISFIKKRKFNKKKNEWGWTVEQIIYVEKNEKQMY